MVPLGKENKYTVFGRQSQRTHKMFAGAVLPVGGIGGAASSGKKTYFSQNNIFCSLKKLGT